MARDVVVHHGAHLWDLRGAMLVVHLDEEGPEDHPEVLDRLSGPLATLLRFVVVSICGVVVSLLFLVATFPVAVATFRVEVVLVQETFGEEVIVDQAKIGVDQVHLVVVASMVVGRATFVGAMGIVDEVAIDGPARSGVDQVHLDELERIVVVVICDQVRDLVSRLHHLEEKVIEGVHQRIASEVLGDRGMVHGGVAIVVVVIGRVLRAMHQAMAIVFDQTLLVAGSAHRLAEVGFFDAFSRLPLPVEHPPCGALLQQPRFLFVDGLRLLPLFGESLPFGILRAIPRVFQRFGLVFAARV